MCIPFVLAVRLLPSWLPWQGLMYNDGGSSHGGGTTESDDGHAIPISTRRFPNFVDARPFRSLLPFSALPVLYTTCSNEHFSRLKVPVSDIASLSTLHWTQKSSQENKVFQQYAS